MAIRTCLWFNGDAEEAARLYTSVIDGAQLGEIRYPPTDAPNTMPGKALTAEFRLGTQEFMLLNGGPQFPPSEYASISVECDTQEQADRYWDALLADGGEPSQCGWLKDRFGVSWQISPKACLALMADPETAEKAFASMLTMQRLDSEQMARDCGR